MPNETLPCTVGFELEFATTSITRIKNALIAESVPVNHVGGYRHTEANATGWDLKTDASCGYEAASPVIRTYTQLEEAAQVASIIKRSGGKVTERCGFHVHIGVGHLDGGAINRLFRFLNRYEEAFYLLAHPSRKDSQYCKSLRYVNIDWIHGEVANRDWCQSWAIDRRIWVNAQCFRRIGTIEFRFMQGTLDANHVTDFVLFLLQVVDEMVHGKKVQCGTAKAKNEKMLLYTLLQQAGCYKNPRDPDRAKRARSWALKSFKKLRRPSRRQVHEVDVETPSINTSGATTGRWTSTGNTVYNVQNVSRPTTN